MVGLNIFRQHILPSITIGKKLFLVVQQLLVIFGRKLKVGSLHDGIHWACFLAKATVNALGHVNVVLGCAATVVGTRFCLNRDGLSWTDRFAQLAGNAAFLSCWIPTQCMLSSETRTDRTLLEGVVDRQLGLRRCFQDLHQSPNHLGQEQLPAANVQNTFRIVSLRRICVVLS